MTRSLNVAFFNSSSSGLTVTSKDVGVEDDADLGHFRDELRFYVSVENAVAIEHDGEKRTKDNDVLQGGRQ